ncbi:MAG: hypothetical protein ACRD47_15860, partial [Nitrososphaeraceae archaeon]
MQNSPTHVPRGLSSSGKAVFVIISATIVGVLVEAGIIRVSGLVGLRDLGLETTIFIALGILCVVSQLTILNYVRNKVGKSLLSHNHMHIGLINKVILAVQLGIISLLIIVLLEVSLAFSYHTILIKAIIISSFVTASALTALLSWRFIIWVRSNKNRLILPYMLASLFIAASAISGALY